MFFKCRNDEDAKALYKKLAKRVHPDFGGNHELMVLLTESYENHLEFLKTVKSCLENTEEKYNPTYEMRTDKVYQGDEQLNILNEIFKYAETHKKFDTSFIESVKEFLDEKGFMSSAQYNRLVKIYYAFHMNEGK